jgi:hypothetical protein
METNKLKNYLLAFEALSRWKSVGDAAELMEALGFGEDRMIVVGIPGMKNITTFANCSEFVEEKCGQILVKFKGGPGADLCGRSVFTATLACFVTDRLLKAMDLYGEDYVVNEITDVWGLRVA